MGLRFSCAMTVLIGGSPNDVDEAVINGHRGNKKTNLGKEIVLRQSGKVM